MRIDLKSNLHPQAKGITQTEPHYLHDQYEETLLIYGSLCFPGRGERAGTLLTRGTGY